MSCWKGLHGYNNALESMRTIFLGLYSCYVQNDHFS